MNLKSKIFKAGMVTALLSGSVLGPASQVVHATETSKTSTSSSAAEKKLDKKAKETVTSSSSSSSNSTSTVSSSSSSTTSVDKSKVDKTDVKASISSSAEKEKTVTDELEKIVSKEDVKEAEALHETAKVDLPDSKETAKEADELKAVLEEVDSHKEEVQKVENEANVLQETKAKKDLEVKSIEEKEKSSKTAIEDLKKQIEAKKKEIAEKKAAEEGQVSNPQTTPQSQNIAVPITVDGNTIQTSGKLFEPNYNDAGSYPVGQCTWGAKVLAPWAGHYWGNGGQWTASAAAAGFKTGTVPKVGAIACWTDGGYGHVAVVTDVQSVNSIQVLESNYLGNQTIGNYRGWFDPTVAQGTVSYIYPPGS